MYFSCMINNCVSATNPVPSSSLSSSCSIPTRWEVLDCRSLPAEWGVGTAWTIQIDSRWCWKSTRGILAHWSVVALLWHLIKDFLSLQSPWRFWLASTSLLLTQNLLDVIPLYFTSYCHDQSCCPFTRWWVHMPCVPNAQEYFIFPCRPWGRSCSGNWRSPLLTNLSFCWRWS